LGVVAAHRSRGNLLIAGMAGLVAGAMSMAAGEDVFAHSQTDTEQADLTFERNELKTDDRESRRNWLRSKWVAAWRQPSQSRSLNN
jgi:hypothetical protein